MMSLAYEKFKEWMPSIEGKTIDECKVMFDETICELKNITPYWKDVRVNLKDDETYYEEDPITKVVSRLKEDFISMLFEGYYHDIRKTHKMLGELIEVMDSPGTAEKFRILVWKYHFLEKIIKTRGIKEVR